MAKNRPFLGDFRPNTPKITYFGQKLISPIEILWGFTKNRRLDISTNRIQAQKGAKSGHHFEAKKGWVLKESLHEQMKFLGGCGSDGTGRRRGDKNVDFQTFKFYLTFENSRCPNYITEKLFQNAIAQNLVPVVAGPPKKEYLQILPAGSFIHIEDFESPEVLSKFLLDLGQDQVRYEKYFEWKKDDDNAYFQLLNQKNSGVCQMFEKLSKSELEASKRTNIYQAYLDDYEECKVKL